MGVSEAFPRVQDRKCGRDMACYRYKRSVKSYIVSRGLIRETDLVMFAIARGWRGEERGSSDKCSEWISLTEELQRAG